MNFQGKVAAITGAGSGIGRALAIELAQRGCALALSSRSAQGLAETVQLVQTPGALVTSSVVDVADRNAVFEWAAQSRAAHGKVNLLFNNAGVSLSSFAETTPLADFQWVMDTNFWGVVHGTQAFLPHLRESGEGHVVNVCSVAGLLALPTQSAYNASKFAVRGYTEALRMELELEGAPVSATCVHPGGVATNIAKASRVDAGFCRASGMEAQVHRDRADRMIQVTTAQSAARQVIAGVERNARRVLVGRDAIMMDFFTRLLGPAYQVLVMRKVRAIRAAERLAAARAAP
ncbi:MAG: SDR family NAD(P)-dependent oxidoreductase [Burkholderiales bacterium]|nr:SDR family NAD(P)-dependent oxidoreductase [Burkholderiales bacterium]